MDISKFLFLFLFVSLSGNIWQWTILKSSVESQKSINIKYKEVFTSTKVNKNSLTQKIPIPNEIKKTGYPLDKEIDNSRLYEEASYKTTKDIESFIINELNYNSQEVSEIFQVLEKSDKKIETFIDKKREKLQGQYDESYVYMFDANDYIMMGKSKLEARELIKKILGEKRFKAFLQFIQDYNHGKYSDSFVPIEI
jgi:hypothetical protein